ncbi:MAG: thiolase C-terminal domain-containing protein [Candidatus Freyarchaeota archaeon]
MVRNVAIVGTGQTKHGKRTDASFPELVYDAVKKALDDAELQIEEIDAVVTGSMPAPMEGVNAPHLYWGCDPAGAVMKPIMRVATCGTTGMSVAHSAFYHVASGLFDVVLAIGAEKQYEGQPQGTMNTVADPAFLRPFTAGAPGAFAMQSNEYMHRYDIPEDRIRLAAAEVSVRNHNDALDNPYAHIKIKITVDDVLKSRIICYPVRLLDVCPSSDGATAVIFASEEKARKITDTPVWVRGVGYRGDEYRRDSDKVIWDSAVEAARVAYKMAGITNPLKQLDVAEIYNPFTFQELLYYECFGFCERGEAYKLVEDRVVFREGELPCDPSGGVLCTNPIGATGITRVAEAALQVQGKAGKHQVPDAETTFAHAMGGAIQLNGVMILGRNPP